jgi:protein-S-isoprenylcysteine O-methyltransferase Ste14
MGRVLAFFYGVVAYAVFLVAFLYAIGFVGNIAVSKSIDSGAAAPFAKALFINAGLLLLFAVQHSVMARRGFKAWWTRIIPKPIERSTYVLLASLLLIFMYWQWVPMPEIIWNISGTAIGSVLDVLFWVGWILVLLATFMINHFELFGLQQVLFHLKNKEIPHNKFTTRFLYHFVRHPIMLGFLIAFWSTSVMSVGHLIYSIATTGYISVGVILEERDLVHYLGDEYREYRSKVSMFIPMPQKKG